MFQGKHITLEHLGRNRYKLVSPYTFAEKTAQEIDAILEELMNAARRSALELAVCRQRLREAVAEEGPVTCPPPPPKPAPPPAEPPPAAASDKLTGARRRFGPKKRGRGGMQYVAKLMEQARAQKAS